MLDSFAFAPAATIIIELVLAIVAFGVRGRRAVAVVVLVQLVTNPLVELICLTLQWHPSLPLTSVPWEALLVAEVAATIVEALLYRMANVTRHPWLMSCVLNATSFIIGLLPYALL